MYTELQNAIMGIKRDHDEAQIEARDSERRAEEFMNLARQKRAEAEAYKNALSRLDVIEFPQ